MKQNTYLANTIDETVSRSKYDTAAKHLVANKPILARILKEVTTEFADCNIEDIENYIEGTPQINIQDLFPKKLQPQKIFGEPLNSTIPNEGNVTFDIRFSAFKPLIATEQKINDFIKVIINVEVQKKYHVGYSFVARGIFYSSRIISEQADTEFTSENYNALKKVYSIWICMETPEKYANTITKYEFKPEDIFGTFIGEERYDLMTVCIIRLSKKEQSTTENQLLHMLTTLFSHQLNAETKKQILEQTHNLKMTEEMIGGMSGMSNLGEALWEEALEQGLENGQTIAKCNAIRNLHNRMPAFDLATILKYEEHFVNTVIHLLDQYPDATDKEIANMLSK